MAQLSIPFVFELRERDPDGSACFGCGDIMYLKAYDLVACFGKSQLRLTAGTLCQSCADLLEADDESVSDPPL